MDNYLYFEEGNMRITLSLHGVFSCFTTSKPSSQTMQECEGVYILIPTRWNLHDTIYEHNDEQMLNWKGSMTEPKDRQRILLSEIQ